MEKIFVGTSWKMNKTVKEAEAYMQQLLPTLPTSSRIQVFAVVPFTDLWHLREITRNTPLWLGAQNMHWAQEGAFTGEVSPKMLAEIGVDLVELGHSERRALFGETDFTVNKKVLAAIANQIIPLVCIGEQKLEKDFGVTREVIGRQVKIALHGIESIPYQRIWIAYEPVWAIGEGAVAAEPAYVGEVHTFIRSVLVEMFGGKQASFIPILYGGSVNDQNAASLIQQPNLDGIFIGRAGWEAESFLNVIRAVESRL